MKSAFKITTAVVLSTALPLTPLLVRAQLPAPPIPSLPSSAPVDPTFRTRAQNLAREAAIKANGGLDQYRPAPALFGPAAESNFMTNADGSLTFSVKGGPVGYTVPTQETVVTVTPSNEIFVLYNGPIRQGIRPKPSTLPQPTSDTSNIEQASFLVRAQNLARQAAIEANGGLDEYRPEASMFGPVDNAPYFRNLDDSVTFVFKGGPPQTPTPTMETAVTVAPNDVVTLNYNRQLR